MAQQQNQGGNQRDQDANAMQGRLADETTRTPGRGAEAEGQELGRGAEGGGHGLEDPGRTADMDSGRVGATESGAIGLPGRTGPLREDELGISGAGGMGLTPGDDARGMGGTSDVGNLDAEGLAALEDDEDEEGPVGGVGEEDDDIFGGDTGPSGPRPD
jgi:hypothetical protein